MPPLDLIIAALRGGVLIPGARVRPPSRRIYIPFECRGVMYILVVEQREDGVMLYVKTEGY